MLLSLLLLQFAVVVAAIISCCVDVAVVVAVAVIEPFERSAEKGEVVCCQQELFRFGLKASVKACIRYALLYFPVIYYTMTKLTRLYYTML